MRDQTGWSPSSSPTIIGCLSIAVFLTVSGCGYSGPKFSVQELKAAMDDPSRKVTVIDVRPAVLFRKGHVPGSRNCQLEKLDEKAADIAALDGEVALICTCGRNALNGVKRLNERGIKTILVVGGCKEWKKAGFPVEVGAGVQSKSAPR